jgi:DNA end-binding protein Ku
VLRATEDNALVLETLFYPDEIRAQDLPSLPEVLVSQAELKMAFNLIDMLQEPFDPTKYRDEYRVALLEMIEAKVNGKEIVATPEAPLPKAVDLMAALKASLEAAKKRHRATPIAAEADDTTEPEELAVAF